MDFIFYLTRILHRYNFAFHVFLNALIDQRQPYIKLEPARSFLRPGDSIVVDCSPSVKNAQPVIWERQGGQALPYNFKVTNHSCIMSMK